MNPRVLALVVAVVVLLSAGTATAAQTDPRFEVYTPEPTLTPGTTTQLTVQVVNDADDPGDTALTATDVNATLLGNETDITVRSGTRSVPDIPDGSVRSVTFTVHVPSDIESGDQTLYLEVGHVAGGSEEVTTVPVTVSVEDRPRFSVESATADAPVGGSGPVEITLTNDGSEDVTDAQVTVESLSPELTFGPAQSVTRHVGTVPAGESATVDVEASVARTAEQVPYALTATASYDDEGGDAGGSRPLAVGVTPTPEQSIAVEPTNSTLLVGDRGTVTATVTNDGPSVIRDATLAVAPTATLTPVEEEQFIGDLAPGESTTVAVPARVAGSADPGERQLDFTVGYTDDSGDRLASDTLRASAAVAPEQSFAVANASSSLIVGDRGTVEGTVTNVGPRSVTDAVVVLAPEAPTVTPVETEAAVGDLAPGESARFSFPVSIASSADPGDLRLPLAVQYDNQNGDRRVSDGPAATVPVTAEQEFTVSDAESTLLVGDRGTVTATVTNDGPETASNAVVRLTAANENVRPRETEAAVGDLAPGESAEVSFPVEVAGSAEAGVRQLTFAVEYENRDGDVRLTDGLTQRVEVAGEQTFSVRDVGGTLRVDDDGELAVTVANDGPLGVSDAVVRLVGLTENANPTATEFAVGDLATGESAEVSFPVEVADAAEAGPRQFAVLVEYRNREGDRRNSDRLSVRTEVGPERPRFSVETDGASVEAGGAGTVTMTITNNGDDPVDDIDAKLFADDPLSTTDDESFVEQLGPGESVELTFGVGAGGGALEKTYPVSVDFQYDEADGDTKLSDSYRVPVSVTVTDDGGPPVVLIAVVVLVVAAAVTAVLWRRR